ncbi:MAG: hypothetical protein EBT03_09210 [Betaproteobacteria bacterium]|nr:hypothetical protein [Betaproteobacteria bacterium]NCA17273.1 hypothetical protein [Betaproteobacteria bacterium]
MSEEVVQPESSEGQGAAPYAEYLDKLPEEIRGDVEPVFKEWDSNVTKKFQEHADFRKQWEPLQDLNLNDVPRDELENLIALRELAAESPEEFDRWLMETVTERGLLGQDSQDPYAAEEDSDPLEDKLSPLQSELQQLKEWKEQQEYESRVSEAMKLVEQQVEEASQKHPDVPKELAEQFLASFAESDPENAVNLAYEAAEKWMAQIQRGTFEDKLAQPEAAEQGSTADGSPEQIRDFRAASKAALARLQGS